MEEKDNGYVGNTQSGANASAITGAEREECCPTIAPTAIGKFKDVDALLKAYDCLQAEFTRRSQRLKQLEKEAENSNLKRTSAEVAEKLRKNAEKAKAAEEDFDGFVTELEQANVRARSSGAILEEPVDKTADERELPMAKIADGSSVAVENRVAESDITVKNEEEKASFTEEASVAQRREKQPSSGELYRLAKDNEEVRLKIIGEYLQSVGKSSAPLLKGGNGLLSAPPMKPKTLHEAGEMALRWFRREGVEQ